MSAASKSEKPTAKKLRDAARKGQTFKARDLATSCLMLCSIFYLASGSALPELMEIYRRIIASGFDVPIAEYMAQLAGLLGRSLWPVILLCFLASAIPTLILTGLALASEALKLNFGALNPINGFKKIFSVRTVKDSIKALLYLGCFGAAFWLTWNTHRQLLLSQLHAQVGDLFAVWARLLMHLSLMFLACIALVVLMDALAEYWLHIKELKMDKDAVKREHKEQEGSPQVKQRRRDLHMELLSAQVKADIRESRMIIANPTHIAIGLYFRPEITLHPFISLLETNQRALAVRAYAAKVGVPVVTDIALARRIYATHQRYSFVQLGEIEQVLRLLIWLEQVEQA